MPASSSSIHIYSQPNRRPKNSYSSLSSTEEEQEEKTTEESSPIKVMKPQETSKKVSNGSLASRERGVRYKECRKNHAANIGGYAVDGCREFMAAGEEGTSAALKCAACNCHRNFHKREVEIDGFWDCSSNSTSPRK